MLWEDRVKMAVGKGLSGKIYDVAGVRLSAVSAGIRYQDRLDLVLIELTEKSKSVGVFTKNAYFCKIFLDLKKNFRNWTPKAPLLSLSFEISILEESVRK